MHKGIAGAIGVAVLAAAGFGGLAAWQGSEVDAFHGKTIPLPGDVFEAKVSTQKLDFLHRGVLVEVRAKGAGTDIPAVATWSGEASLGLSPRLRLVLSEEDKRAAGLEVDDELTVGFSPFQGDRSGSSLRDGGLQPLDRPRPLGRASQGGAASLHHARRELRL